MAGRKSILWNGSPSEIWAASEIWEIWDLRLMRCESKMERISRRLWGLYKNVWNPPLKWTKRPKKGIYGFRLSPHVYSFIWIFHIQKITKHTFRPQAWRLLLIMYVFINKAQILYFIIKKKLKYLFKIIFIITYIFI